MAKPPGTLNYQSHSAPPRRSPKTLSIDIAIGIFQVVAGFLVGLLTIVITYPIARWTTWRLVDAADKPLGQIPIGLHRIFRGKKPPSNIPTVEEAIAEAYKRQAREGLLRRNLEQHSER